MRGHQMFADALAEAGLVAQAGRVVAPTRVAVQGRPGVGVATVRAALALAGMSLADVVDTDADIDIRVIAEVAKPEDLAPRCPLMVFNKADLSGFGAGGPVAAAQRRCAAVTDQLGVPVQPLVALLAVAALDAAVLDDALVDALRMLVDEPADLRTPDGFVACEHRLSRALRQRLVDSLDLFGIAHGVVALRRGGGGAEVRAALRRVSGVDDVVREIDRLTDAARYRRVCAVVDDVAVLAVTDARLAEFLAADHTVLARMAAAVDVVEGLGVRVDPADDADAHLRRAVHWRRLAAGPLAALHRDCAVDIARGSVRLLAGGTA